MRRGLGGGRLLALPGPSPGDDHAAQPRHRRQSGADHQERHRGEASHATSPSGNKIRQRDDRELRRRRACVRSDLGARRGWSSARSAG
jgi:hypothetical protein